MKFSTIIAFVFAALTALSCAHDWTTAKSVSVRPGKGGVLTLNPHEDPRARAKADAIMNQACGGKKPEITEEGEAVVGVSKRSQTDHNSGGSGGIKLSSNGFGFGSGGNSSETDSTERQLTEWRVTYECK
jgi:hypothetical protein